MTSTKLGLWFTEILRRNYDHKWAFGLAVQSVRFADHRSGWCAIRCTLSFGPWSWALYPVRWEPPYVAPVRILSLREVLEQNHPKPDGDDDET